MADIPASAWSETAASNTAPSPDGWPPNSSPNIVYTTDREMMGAIKREWNRGNATVTSTGSANAQVLTFTSPPVAMVRGMRYAFIAGFQNTGPATLTISPLAPVALQANGAALVGGELRVGLITECVFDGTNLQLIAGSGAGSGAYLPLTGGTLSGQLTVIPPNLIAAIIKSTNASGTYLSIDKVGSGAASILRGASNGSARWDILLGNLAAEGSGNAGADLNIARYDNTGTQIDVPFAITRSTGAVAIKGDTSGNPAAAGFVGEYSASVVTAPGTTLTTATAANVTSIPLTAGDWDVSGEVWFAVGTGGLTQMAAAISNTSATLPGIGMNVSRALLQATFPASVPQILTLIPCRVNLAAPTTYYLVAQAGIPSGTTTAYGRLGARRIR